MPDSLIATAREMFATAGFFETAFGPLDAHDQPQDVLHERALARLRTEIFSWTDEPVVPDAPLESQEVPMHEHTIEGLRCAALRSIRRHIAKGPARGWSGSRCPIA